MPDPLETFLSEFVDAVGGLADEIEPQVYDVLFADADKPLRIAFDPDALPEHPSAQLLSFGSALLDEWLTQAHRRGRVAIAYVDDVHLRPHALEQRVRRDLVLPEMLTLDIQSIRPLYITHALFWFEVTFVSDEKEQVLYPIALDRYYGRQVRYLESLTAGGRLSDVRRWAYPDAPSRPLDQSYLAARESVARTLSTEVNARQQQLQARLAAQAERMRRYYADLRAELHERIEKSAARAEEMESLRLRLAALDREEALRLEESRRKAVLRVQVTLKNLLHIKMPRLFLGAFVLLKEEQRGGAFRPQALTVTWDPLSEKTDALDCPHCRHPTFELRLSRAGMLVCPNCEGLNPFTASVRENRPK